MEGAEGHATCESQGKMEEEQKQGDVQEQQESEQVPGQQSGTPHEGQLEDKKDELMEEHKAEAVGQQNLQEHETAKDEAMDEPMVENKDEPQDERKELVEPDDTDEHQGRKAPRRNLRARVLADLGEDSPAEAMAKIAAKLLAHDELVAAAKAKESAAASVVQAVLLEVQAAADEVKLAEQKEAEVLARIKAIDQRRKAAVKQTAKQRAVLQERQDMLVLIEMEAMSRSRARETDESFETEQETKKQRIEELERVMTESRKQVEELKQKEREAKEAMKRLLKEQQKDSRLGPFGRRTRAAMAKPAAAIASAVADPAASEPATDSAAAPALVHVKKELGALQAFARPRDLSALPVVINLDDSQE